MSRLKGSLFLTMVAARGSGPIRVTLPDCGETSRDYRMLLEDADFSRLQE